MSDMSCCCTGSDNLSGCMVCGRELFCTPDKPLRAKCFYCGKEKITHMFCPEGHYVCDDCHRKDILDLLLLACLQSDLTDPLALLVEIFKLPNLQMHGPEYHSIVPAVLVTAYGNSTGHKDEAAVREAITRGKAVFGGICGTHGACGACIGVGIASSVINRTTPYSTGARGEANRMTALALQAVSRMGGPRCCKREAMLAVETAREHFHCFPAGKTNSYVCGQYPANEMCIKNSCPYYPQRSGGTRQAKG
ncbi:MAG TPA: hypothetical protein GX699_08880 [Firmicutes bacterium]|nr:hypothetical protein [Bacillota bacterium]